MTPQITTMFAVATKEVRTNRWNSMSGFERREIVLHYMDSPLFQVSWLVKLTLNARCLGACVDLQIIAAWHPIGYLRILSH